MLLASISDSTILPADRLLLGHTALFGFRHKPAALPDFTQNPAADNRSLKTAEQLLF
jgi:hypothetical protein